MKDKIANDDGKDGGGTGVLDRLRDHLVTEGVDVARHAALRGLYVAGERDEMVRTGITDMLANLAQVRGGGERFEARGLVIEAPSGAGKSECVARALRGHPFLKAGGVNGRESLVLSVRCFGSPTLAVLGDLIVSASGFETKGELKEFKVWKQVRERVATRQILILHIDELNNLVENNNERDHQRIINNLKALLNNDLWPVALLLTGTKIAGDMLRRDVQLERRLDWMALPGAGDAAGKAVIERHVRILCERAGLQLPSGFTDRLAPRLTHAGRGQVGIATEINVAAITHALSRKAAAIDIEDYATVLARRIDCSFSENTFLADAREHTRPWPSSDDDGGAEDLTIGSGRKRDRGGRSASRRTAR